jgi:hypothetical protein
MMSRTLAASSSSTRSCPSPSCCCLGGAGVGERVGGSVAACPVTGHDRRCEPALEAPAPVLERAPPRRAPFSPRLLRRRLLPPLTPLRLGPGLPVYGPPQALGPRRQPRQPLAPPERRGGLDAAARGGALQPWRGALAAAGAFVQRAAPVLELGAREPAGGGGGSRGGCGFGRGRRPASSCAPGGRFAPSLLLHAMPGPPCPRLCNPCAPQPPHRCTAVRSARTITRCMRPLTSASSTSRQRAGPNASCRTTGSTPCRGGGRLGGRRWRGRVSCGGGQGGQAVRAQLGPGCCGR